MINKLKVLDWIYNTRYYLLVQIEIEFLVFGVKHKGAHSVNKKVLAIKIWYFYLTNGVYKLLLDW